MSTNVEHADVLQLADWRSRPVKSLSRQQLAVPPTTKFNKKALWHFGAAKQHTATSVAVCDCQLPEANMFALAEGRGF
jgi:hypothetical protein